MRRMAGRDVELRFRLSKKYSFGRPNVKRN